ncbi:hypothetical protein K1719_018444 [Acacia pycnantha]|nr:hypothetical protein K1719_018444 [Acacia pycnantha]
MEEKMEGRVETLLRQRDEGKDGGRIWACDSAEQRKRESSDGIGLSSSENEVKRKGTKLSEQRRWRAFASLTQICLNRHHRTVFAILSRHLATTFPPGGVHTEEYCY